MVATLTVQGITGSPLQTVTFAFDSGDSFFVPLNIALDAGDGSAIQSFNLIHTYQNGGTYTATVTAIGTTQGGSNVTYQASTSVTVGGPQKSPISPLMVGAALLLALNLGGHR